MRLRTASFRLVSLVSLVALAHSAFAACGDNPGDANAVAAARQASSGGRLTSAGSGESRPTWLV